MLRDRHVAGDGIRRVKGSRRAVGERPADAGARLRLNVRFDADDKAGAPETVLAQLPIVADLAAAQKIAEIAQSAGQGARDGLRDAQVAARGHRAAHHIEIARAEDSAGVQADMRTGPGDGWRGGRPLFVGETRGQGHEALVVGRKDVSAGHFFGKGHEVLIRRPRVGRGRENRVEGMRRQGAAQRHAGRERLHRLEVTIHLADRADGGWRGSVLAGREQRVGRQQRAVSVADLVRFRIEHVENVELEL